MIDPSRSWERWSTRDRIIALDEAGVYLEVYKEKSAKEIQRMKERKIEHHIEK
jgi:hypothetical protein